MNRVSAGIASLAVVLIRFYRVAISPLLPPRCRHLPTCSDYCIEALEKHGAVTGSYYGIRRVLRCHPWGTSGLDPVPEPRERTALTDSRG